MFMKLPPKPDPLRKEFGKIISDIRPIPVKPPVLKTTTSAPKVIQFISKPSTMTPSKPPAKRQLIEIQDVQIIRPPSTQQMKMLPLSSQKLMVPMTSRAVQQPIKLTSIVTVPTTTTNIVTTAKHVRPQMTVLNLPHTKVVEVKKRLSVVGLQKQGSSTPKGVGCIVCKANIKKKTNFCSEECLRKYVIIALPKAVHSDDEIAKKRAKKNLFEDLLLSADSKPKFDRICVYEKTSGQILTGDNAPTSGNIRKWLQDHPTFEIVQAGTQQALEIEVSLKCIFNIWKICEYNVLSLH